MSPTYKALKKLAVGLGISVPQLLTQPVNSAIDDCLVVTKRGQGTAHATVTYEHELLSESLLKKDYTPSIQRYEHALLRNLKAGCAMMVKSFFMCSQASLCFTLNFMKLFSRTEVTLPIMPPLWDIT